MEFSPLFVAMILRSLVVIVGVRAAAGSLWQLALRTGALLVEGIGTETTKIG